MTHPSRDRLTGEKPNRKPATKALGLVQPGRPTRPVLRASSWGSPVHHLEPRRRPTNDMRVGARFGDRRRVSVAARLAGWAGAPGSDRGALLARRLGSLGRQLRHPADRSVPHFLRGSLVREMLEAAGAGGLGVWFRPDGPTRSSAPVLLVLLVVHAAWVFGARRAEAASSFASWSTWARSASGSFSMSRVRTLMV